MSHSSVEAAEQILKDYMAFGKNHGTGGSDFDMVPVPVSHRFDATIGKYNLKVRVVFDRQDQRINITKVFTEAPHIHDIRDIISDEVLYDLFDKAETEAHLSEKS